MVNAEVVPVDPSVNTIVLNAVSEALRGAQAATLGIAEVTDANAPSSLEAKIIMQKNTPEKATCLGCLFLMLYNYLKKLYYYSGRDFCISLYGYLQEH